MNDLLSQSITLYSTTQLTVACCSWCLTVVILKSRSGRPDVRIPPHITKLPNSVVAFCTCSRFARTRLDYRLPTFDPFNIVKTKKCQEKSSGTVYRRRTCSKQAKGSHTSTYIILHISIGGERSLRNSKSYIKWRRHVWIIIMCLNCIPKK